MPWTGRGPPARRAESVPPAPVYGRPRSFARASTRDDGPSRRAQGCAYATYVGTWKSRFRWLEGEDELIETAADNRTIRRIGKGAESGSYVCSAANVTEFATYGNVIAVSKSTVAFVKDMKDKAPKTAKRRS